MRTEDIIVLVTQDRGLRSAIAAGLGMNGVTLVTVDSCRDRGVSKHLRRATLLIVDDSLRDIDRFSWVARLRHRSKLARVIVLKEEVAAEDLPGIDVIAKAAAAQTIMALLQQWRGALATRE